MVRNTDELRAHYASGKCSVFTKDSKRESWKTPFKAPRLRGIITLAFNYSDE
jgi:hypothetical protein